MSQAAAITQLARQCAADVWPTLSTDDLIDLVGQARRMDANGYRPDALPEWEPARAYSEGDVVVPTVRNGYYYRVVTVEIPILFPGQPTPPLVSADTEPTWSITLGDQVTDGYIIWQVAGRAYWDETYDLAWATVEAWRIKAGKASGAINLSDNGQTINREAVYQHCVAQVAEWKKQVYGSVVLGRYTTPRTSLVPPL